MRNSSNQALRSLEPQAFGSLSETDRHALRQWIGAAHAAGFDDVRDLTARRWPAPMPGTVIGVYMRGDQHAAWLAVEQDGSWAVASRVDGSVSRPVTSLMDALDLVYRTGGTAELS